MKPPTVIRDEQGLTLIELVISISLLVVVIVPITTAMLFGIVNSNGIRDRVADSAAAQLVSTYFAPDVQSAQTVALTGTGTCSGAVLPGDATQLRLGWTDPATAASTTVVYVSRPAPNTTELHRIACTTGQPSETTLLVHHLAATSPVTVTCDTNVGSCPFPVSTVWMRIRAFNDDSESPIYEAFEFELHAKRRTAT